MKPVQDFSPRRPSSARFLLRGSIAERNRGELFLLISLLFISGFPVKLHSEWKAKDESHCSGKLVFNKRFDFFTMKSVVISFFLLLIYVYISIYIDR